MKYFVITDVHGEYDVMIESLKNYGFDKNNKNHCLISLGDMFDRGYKSVKVYQYLESLPRKILLLGNHDEFFLEFLSGVFSHTYWHVTRNGMWATIRDFADVDDWRSSISDDPSNYYKYLVTIRRRYPKLADFMRGLKHAAKIGNKIFTHAGFKNTDIGFMTNIHAQTPYEIEKMVNWGLGDSGKFNYIFGHWHIGMLNSYFKINEDQPILNSHKPFIYKDFIGLDTACNLTKILQIYVFESDDNVITYNTPQFLEIMQLDE